jgi:hypothetical protein
VTDVLDNFVTASASRDVRIRVRRER